MDECEVGTIENMIQVVVIIVDLRRRELPFIDNILGREGTDVETLRKRAVHKGK